MNAVPSPPANQHDFQRAGSVSVALTQIELTVHHHIDTAFSSLSRLIIDKHDRMMDQTLHRLESLEDVVSKGLRAVKGEIKDVSKASSVSNTKVVLVALRTVPDKAKPAVDAIDRTPLAASLLVALVTRGVLEERYMQM